MGQILHKRARTTQETRSEIQKSKKSLSELVKLYGVSKPTIIKWRKRDSVNDLKMGPKKTRTVLTELEQEIICEFRKKTQLSLDDCYISLKEEIPNLSRSNLHRCLQRNGISVLKKRGYKKEKTI